MIQITDFTYMPAEAEREKASIGYITSLIAVFIGLPLPIFNLLATLIFYLANTKSTYFVRWHCVQALLSQLSLFFVNTILVWWAVYLYLTKSTPGSWFIIYLTIAMVLNLIELIFTIITAINVRKGKHVKWVVYGSLTDRLIRF